MAKQSVQPRWSIILVCTLLLTSINWLTAPAPAAACFWIWWCQPKSVGKAKGRNPDLARRDSDICKSADAPLTALVPRTNEVLKTSVAHPTFWFYLPELKPIAVTNDTTISNSKQQPEIKLKFVLQDEQHNDIYQAHFQLPETPKSGAIGLRFLTSQAALKIGKQYRWYFLVYCNDPDEIYEPAFVEGMIQRVALSADRQSQIDRATPKEQVVIYGDARLWYDTLTALDRLSSAPDNAIPQQDAPITWTNALQNFVGLPATIARKPVIGRYYVRNTE
ncbi:DUF928 domain-containing protein [filamentous cyanobacterium LEGE 11480]|uniref:DUF928 domain-containing protein n=1 Tax=Romeriopsis navalis LEGE 11480 TaxID=2777977 RepID=A0A928Z3T3_9CYAN|nr:DUF928 domain-containing protein [Romeriopsis navalis]MBE9031831.1 DUF928 domain-containing protein [Romeriopsis navalis LEGE 11480]